MIYLDHAATTAMRPAARDAWLAVAGQVGNSSSVHSAGRGARRIVEDSREQIAEDLAIEPDRVVITSGGTESDNLAVVGGYRARNEADPRRTVIVLSRIEHKAVLEPAEQLTTSGAELEWLDVDQIGRVSVEQLREILIRRGGEVALVAVMWANNEVGSVQDIGELTEVCREFDVPLHTDAVQALGNIPIAGDVSSTMALSAHKVGGPSGFGLLLVDPQTAVQPLVRGGGQEAGLRAGSLDVAGAAAAAAAIHEAVTQQAEHSARMSGLRDQLLRGITQQAQGSSQPFEFSLNSTEAGLPGLVSVSFPGCDGDALMMLLDEAGISVSTGSACNVGIPKPSYILTAMGAPHTSNTIRISFGWSSGSGDIAALLAALPRAVAGAAEARNAVGSA